MLKDQYLVKYESDLIAAHAAQKLNDFELPSGEKIFAEYFNEKNDLINSLKKAKSVEDMLRNIINMNTTQQLETDEENGGHHLMNNIKMYLNQQEQFKQALSSSAVYINSVLNQVANNFP